MNDATSFARTRSNWQMDTGRSNARLCSTSRAIHLERVIDFIARNRKCIAQIGRSLSPTLNRMRFLRLACDYKPRRINLLGATFRARDENLEKLPPEFRRSIRSTESPNSLRDARPRIHNRDLVRGKLFAVGERERRTRLDNSGTIGPVNGSERDAMVYDTWGQHVGPLAGTTGAY